MRGDLAAALLHDPEILYLDEPTIGLDVVAKQRIRDFLRHLNQERALTVLLTTHDMTDIAQLCQRMLLIDPGRLLYDGAVAAIRDRFGVERTLVVDLAEDETLAGPLTIGPATQVRADGRVDGTWRLVPRRLAGLWSRRQGGFLRRAAVVDVSLAISGLDAPSQGRVALNGTTITASLCNGVATYDSKLSVYCGDCADPTCIDGNGKWRITVTIA